MAQEPLDSAAPHSTELSLLDVAVVVARHLRLLILLPAAAGLIALAISSLRTPPPASFTATAKALLPPGAAPVETYSALLRSEAIAVRLVDRFSLKQAYGTSSDTQARAVLASRTKINPGRVLVVSVEDSSPGLAAELANGYIEELRKLAHSFAITEAAQRRVLYEQYVQRTKEDLLHAKQRLPLDRDAQTALGGKLVAADQALTKLRARVTAEEIRLATLRSFASEPDLGAELASLRDQLNALDSRTRRERNGGKDKRAVEASVAGEFKYREALLELIVKQYEFARINEASTELQLLDAATPPDSGIASGRSLRNRALIAVVAAGAAFFLTLLGLFIAEGWRRQNASAETARKLALIRDALRFKR